MSLKLDETGWVVAEGKTDEYPFQVRYRKFEEGLPVERYPQRLNIFWEMTDYFENGYPTSEELKLAHEFEDRLVEAVEHDEFAIMSVVLTGNGSREFVFHTNDPQQFIERLTAMPQEPNPYPIEIHCNEDSEWDYYFGEVEKVIDA